MRAAAEGSIENGPRSGPSINGRQSTMITQHDNPQRRRTGRRVLYISLIVVLGLPLGLYVKARIQWARRVDRQIQAIKAQGLPTTQAELVAWYRLPSDAAENAADYYLDAFACYVPPGEEDANKVPWAGTAERPGRTEPLSDSTSEAIGRLLAANTKALELLHGAAGIPACRYPFNYKKGQGILLTWLAGIRKATFLLACETLVYTDQGEKDKVAQSIAAGLAVGDSLLMEPVLTSQLVRGSIRSAVLTNLERVLSSHQLSMEQLAAIDRGLARGSDPNAYYRGLVGERASHLDLLQERGGLNSISSSAGYKPIGPVGSTVYSGLGLMRRDQGEYLEIMASRLKVWELPESQRLSAAKAMDEEVKRIPSTHVGTRMLVGPLALIDEVQLRSMAQLRAARTGLAIERYRLKAGSLPPNLDALVPEYMAAVPLDPFTGQAIKYKPLAKGYVVYSVGNDLSDDGGRERTARKHGEPPAPCDITFIVER
jgi:hypothetical protein